MTHKHRPIAVLCDFDGTIATDQTMDFLYTRFAACGMAYAHQWERGEISTPEEIRLTFTTIDADKQEMEDALEEIQFDEGFHGFLRLAEDRGYLIAVVSDGLEWYIDFILKRHGISDLPIYANRIHFNPKGFRFEFPWSHEDTPMRGVSKPNIVRCYREKAAHVVYVGDGRTDVDVIHRVDLLYAKGWLARHCKKQRVDAIEFVDWQDLISKWREP